MTLRRRLLLVFLGLAVLPIVLLGALVVVGTLRYVERQGREDLAGALAVTSGRIGREVVVERASLEALVADWNPSGPPAGAPLAAWLSSRAEVRARMSDDPAFTSRLLVIEGAADSCEAVEGHLSTLGTGVRTARLAASSLPESYRRIAAGVAAGRAAPVVTALLATGPVLAIPVVIHGAGEPGVILIEVSILALLRGALGRPGAHDLVASLAAARDEESGRWRYIFHTDPVRIGLEVSDADWPAGAGRLLAEATAGIARPAGAAAGGTRAGWSFARRGAELYATGIDPQTGWLLGGVLSLAPSLAPLRQSVGVALLLLGLMILLVVAGIVWVTRGIGSVVAEIAASTGAIARGDLERTLQVRRSDEFGAIADHVNLMARELVVTAESRSIARLSARLTHDLKGVASQMNLLLHNLKLNYDDPEFRSEFPDLMQDLVGRVESLVLQLRRGGEEHGPRLESVELEPLIREVVAGRRAAWPSVSVRIQPGPAQPVLADRELLRGALENIVSNALEAMPGSGRLTVRTGGVAPPPRGPAAGARCFVEVEDTGVGMSQAFLERDLFQPFATTKPKGIGLGLYQARQAVARMGGSIEVASREGAGTRVRIELPTAGAAPCTAAGDAGGARPQPPGAEARGAAARSGAQGTAETTRPGREGEEGRP
jgi:signal transduction histidine kinase